MRLVPSTPQGGDPMKHFRNIVAAGLMSVSVAAAVPVVADAASKAPNVRCQRLDNAERTLYRKGFDVKITGGGLFGVVNKAGWVVVHQSQRSQTVTLTAGRSC